MRNWSVDPAVRVTEMADRKIPGDGVHVSPVGGNTDIGQRDSGHLAVPSSSAAVRHRAGAKPTRQWNEAMGKPRKSGRMRTSA